MSAGAKSPSSTDFGEAGKFTAGEPLLPLCVATSSDFIDPRNS